ncbi:MAG: sulfurtransferase complex subunit TusD [Gammaproteobacteria bacterium]|nr:MAG: sulfurtransferase complex subunit TusD [Gammaproteobacteria bacterium]
MSKLAVIVTSSPLNNLTVTAINIILHALEQGVEVVGVFFYQDGVLNANTSIQIPIDEFQTLAAWQELHHKHDLALHLCITAGEKRGLVCEGSDLNIDQAFCVSGLGELVELTAKADRVVQL